MTTGEHAYVGVALAAGRIAVALHSPDSGPTAVLRSRQLLSSTEDDVLAEVQEEVQRLGRTQAPVAGVGLSVGGHVSADGRRVLFAPGLAQVGKDWKDVDVADRLEKALSVPASVENDVNCMCAYQRRCGAAKDVSDFIVVYLAPNVEGLGCGIVASGQLIRGGSGGAGEFGHIVIQPDGPSCRCGNRGCLEAMVAVENFDRDMNWGGRSGSRGFTEASRMLEEEGYDRAGRVFERSGRYLGQGLATAVNLLNPRMIVLGGPPELIPIERDGSGHSGALFMRGVQQAMKDNAFSSMALDCEVVVDRLDLGTAASGAALLMQEHVLARSPL